MEEGCFVPGIETDTFNGTVTTRPNHDHGQMCRATFDGMRETRGWVVARLLDKTSTASRDTETQTA